jgi:hypothetical protein
MDRELFKKVLVACAAVTTFGGSVYIGDQLVSSYIRSKAVASEIIGASEQPAPDQEPAKADTKPKASFSFSFGK